ncbi:hypothetical protein FKG96_12470 [Olivibacter sp. LS-1]|uniref:phage tail protein n=1 Tax=Olivibacter sp. LS-1 TaxID=2592345 RepID=UPI0011EA80F0|nr:phage tail protein [Olivibacter sp. LS-1]QEL01586.1 hypothetical protein FKG96_12470 [Olivibacter sp. LS-1]
MIIKVYRNNIEVEQLPVSRNATLTHELMGAHRIDVTGLRVARPLNIQIGDTINYKGEIFTINTVDEPTKHSNFNYEYNIVFEGIRYQLYDKLFMFEDNTDFPFYGTLREHLQLLVDNISEIHLGWTLGIIEETEPKHSSWDNVSCRVALTNIAELFKMEWYLSGKTINMVKSAGNTTTIRLGYGKGKGLYNLSRQYVEDKNVVTRVYGKGGTRNLPPSYGGNRLSLPEKFLEANVDKYGVKEGVYLNEEIYPKREGTLTSVGPYENADQRSFTVTDTSLDFDINSQLMEGVEAKIAFNTGELAGFDFVITKYNHSTKTITFKADVSDQDYVMPNQNFMAKVGDKYVLWDIIMPQSYEDAAIIQLREETAEYRNQNSVPQVLYGFAIDVLDMKRKGWMVNPGDKVNLEDEQLKVNEEVRINSVTYPIQFPEILEPGTAFQATVANFIPYTVQERVIKDTIENQREIKVVDRRNAERARRNAMNLRQLRDLIFDPDDYFDTSNLRPNSIETLYLSVGAKSQNFGLNGVSIQPNAGANPNSIAISAGTLIHYEIQIEGLGYVWQMGQSEFSNLTAAKAYYLSAKCSKNALTGSWYISETPMSAEQEAGYYHFNVGVLYPVKDGFRGFDFTKGMTYIVGDTITTGTIRSLDGLTVLGLNDGSLRLGDFLKFNTADNPGQLDISARINVLPGGNAATKDDVDKISVGGRNYVLGTASPRTLTFTGGNNEVRYLYPLKAEFYNKEITFHFDYAIANTAPFPSDARIALQVQRTTVGSYLHRLTPDIPISDANKSGHYKRTFTQALPSSVGLGDTVYIHVATYGITGPITFSNVKLELGNRETDWSEAPEDIDSSINEAKQQAENAQQTADNVASKTNFLQTTIDGNVIATGTMLVGDALGNNNGGITGIVDDGSVSPVREWYGVPFANRYSAPWRVHHDGSFVSTKGQIGDMIISGGYLSNTQGNGGVIISSQNGQFSGVGVNVLPVTSGVKAVARFENHESNDLGGTNYALLASAMNASINIAALIQGDIRLNGVMRGFGMKTVRQNTGYEIQNDDTCVNIVSTSPGTISLPPSPIVGQAHFLTHQADVNFTILGNGNEMRVKNQVVTSTFMSWGDLWVWDGFYWNRILNNSE